MYTDIKTRKTSSKVRLEKENSASNCQNVSVFVRYDVMMWEINAKQIKQTDQKLCQTLVLVFNSRLQQYILLHVVSLIKPRYNSVFNDFNMQLYFLHFLWMLPFQMSVTDVGNRHIPRTLDVTTFQ